MSTVEALFDEVEIDWSATARARSVPGTRRRGRRRPSARTQRLALIAVALLAVGAAALAYVDPPSDGALPPAPELRAPQAYEAPAAAKTAAPPAATLDAVAHCESRGDPAAVSPHGTYRGKYQFDMATWQSVGGVGDPALAGEAEQDRRARALAAERGTSPWPVCGPAVAGR
jgi:hypothetical protein